MNQEHVLIVKQGIGAIIEWQNQHPNEQLDVAEGDFSGADLSGLDLSGLNLYEANFKGANLRRTNFRGAILCDANLSEARLMGAQFGAPGLGLADLSGACLRGAELTSALLFGVDLSRADLSQSDLSHALLNQANLNNAKLDGAKLVEASLLNASCVGARFVEADLTSSDMTGAVLEGADLTNARLYGVSPMRGRTGWRKLCEAIWPTRFWFLLNRTHIRGTRFDAHSFDPYSILRRTYTGPKLTFVFFLTVVALLPLIGQAMFWSAVSQAEARLVPVAVSAVEGIAKALARVPDQKIQEWVNRANRRVALSRATLRNHDKWDDRLGMLQGLVGLVEEVRQLIADLRQRVEVSRADLDIAESWVEQAQAVLAVLAPDGNPVMEERRVWELVVGLKHGFAQSTLAVVLLLYNVARSLLTYQLSSLRDNEERTGDSPALSEYWWLFRIHRFAALALYVSIASGLWRLGEMTFAVVLVPA